MMTRTRNRNPFKKAGCTAVTLLLTASVLVSCGKAPQGEKGADGKSAYQIAVDAGFSGSYEEWLLSLKGEKGGAGNANVCLS